MLSEINAVCITLDKRNKKRAQRALSEIRKLGFKNPRFFDGVDGRKISDVTLKSIMSPRAYFELKKGRYVHEALSGVGSIGCYLAHVNAWKACLKSGNVLAIFEDDFVAKSGSKEKMEIALKEASSRGFDILRFQHRRNPDYGEYLEDIDSKVLMSVLRTEGATAYIITPKAAKLLLSKSFPINAQVDHYIDLGCFYFNLSNLTTIDDLFDDPQLKSRVNHNSLKMYHDNFNGNTYLRHKYCILMLVLALVLAIVFAVKR